MLKPVGAIVLGLCLVVVLVCPAHGEDWPCWRGPRGDGSSHETGVPGRWSATENIAWKTALPGIGHASPIVQGEQVYTVSCLPETSERVLLALDRRTGALLWQRTVLKTPLEKKHTLNSHASSTPASDGQFVYATFLDNQSDDPKVNYGAMVVAAYDKSGNQRWLVRPGVFSSVHGYCSCPVVYEDLLIVNGDHDGESYIVALDRQSGSTRWKTAREHRTRSYVTPIIRQFAGKQQMILSGSKTVASYDPRSGQQHWTIDGPTEQFVASLVENGRYIFLTAGFPERHILAIRPDGSGNVTDTHIVWRTTENCAYVPSPVVVGNWLLVVADNGIASCFDCETGARAWKQRLGRHFSASLIAAEGLAYFLDDDGVMTVVRPGSEFTEVARNELGESCFSSPAISGQQWFIRGEKHLYCIGK